MNVIATIIKRLIVFLIFIIYYLWQFDCYNAKVSNVDQLIITQLVHYVT